MTWLQFKPERPPEGPQKWIDVMDVFATIYVGEYDTERDSPHVKTEDGQSIPIDKHWWYKAL